MKRNEARSVSEILTDILKGQNLDRRLREIRAAEIWPMIVGPAVNQRTIERRVDNGVMKVRIASASMRQELMMHKETIITSINKNVGEDTINDLKFM